jgi:hypothetical protein
MFPKYFKPYHILEVFISYPYGSVLHSGDDT